MGSTAYLIPLTPAAFVHVMGPSGPAHLDLLKDVANEITRIGVVCHCSKSLAGRTLLSQSTAIFVEPRIDSINARTHVICSGRSFNHHQNPREALLDPRPVF